MDGHHGAPLCQYLYRWRLRRRHCRPKPETDIEKYDYKFAAVFCINFSYPVHFAVVKRFAMKQRV